MRCHRMDAGFHAADVSSADTPFFYCHALGMCSWSYNARAERQMRFRCLSPTSRKCCDVPFPFCFVPHLITGFSSNSPFSSNFPNLMLKKGPLSPGPCWGSQYGAANAATGGGDYVWADEICEQASGEEAGKNGLERCHVCAYHLGDQSSVTCDCLAVHYNVQISVSLALCSCNNCEEFSKSLLLLPLGFHVQQAPVSVMYHFIFLSAVAWGSSFADLLVACAACMATMLYTAALM